MVDKKDLEIIVKELNKTCEKAHEIVERIRKISFTNTQPIPLPGPKSP